MTLTCAQSWQISSTWRPVRSTSKTETGMQLLNEGAHMNAKDEESLTPLIWAASSGHERVVGLLLENRADSEAQSCHGTALHIAAEGGH